MGKLSSKKGRIPWRCLLGILCIAIGSWWVVTRWLFPDPLSSAFQELKSGMRREEALKLFATHCPECEFEFTKDATTRKTYLVFYWNWETFNEPMRKKILGHTLQYSNNSYVSLECTGDWLLAADHAHNRQLFIEYPFDTKRNKRYFRGYSGTSHECFGMRCTNEFFKGFHFLTEKELAGVQMAKEQHQKNKRWLCHTARICL